MTKDFEFMLIEQCAPTLAGVKAANLFSFHMNDIDEVYRYVFNWNEKLSAFGVSVRLLKVCQKNSSFLVYVYRNKWLSSILEQEDVKEFLKTKEYTGDETTEQMLLKLSERICKENEFPHEIGVFLGYPLVDVIGFIDNKGQNYTYSGHWKSYGDPLEAEKRFNIYRKCTTIYKKMFAKGESVLGLAVSV